MSDGDRAQSRRVAPKINLIGGDAYCTTGGIQAVNRFFIKELIAAGRLRTAFLLWDDRATVSPEGAEVLRQGDIRLFGLKRLRFVWDLIVHAIRFPTDLWLCTHVNYAALTLFLTLLSRSRAALFVYAAELDEDFTWSKKAALRRMPTVVAISRYTGNKARQLGVPAERLFLMYLGTADPCPEYQPDRDRERLLLFVGRMDERYKGQLELLDAMSLLRKRHPGMRLLFVGGGRTIEEWKKEARERSLDDVVTFAGRVSNAELHSAYERAAVFAMPSDNEGFGLVYVEAMAHGIPCVGGDRDAACEVIAHGKTGYCVPTGNSTALADAISELLKHEGLRAEMGRAARQRFVENFDEDAYRRRFSEVLQRWEGFAA